MSAACIVDKVALVPSLRKYLPDDCVPVNKLIAACCVVAPEPPLATDKVPVTPLAKFVDPELEEVLAKPYPCPIFQ